MKELSLELDIDPDDMPDAVILTKEGNGSYRVETPDGSNPPQELVDFMIKVLEKELKSLH